MYKSLQLEAGKNVQVHDQAVHSGSLCPVRGEGISHAESSAARAGDTERRVSYFSQLHLLLHLSIDRILN